MQFNNFNMFHLLWLVGVLVGFLFWANKNRLKKIALFVQSQLADKVILNDSPQRRRNKQILLIMALVFAVIALARPQWGFDWQEIKREGLDILVVVDTSKSMLTQDVRPNRLERTKLAVKDLIKKLKGDRIGLIAFAGDAFLMCPLTVDYDGFLLSLNDLKTGSIPRGGTNIERAIKEALKGYKDIPNKYKAVIVVTDGDNLEGDPLETAKLAKKEGVKIYTIGIGTPEGELIRTPGSVDKFLKDSSGNFVKSRLNETLLKELALNTGGAYVRASGAQFGLDYIYENYLTKMEKRGLEAKMEKKFHERFQWPLSIACLLLIFESCIIPRRKQ